VARSSRTEEWLKKPGTVGKAWPISEIAIFDDDGSELPANEIGTVYMAMSAGKLRVPQGQGEDREEPEGRFFTVGDVGYLDEDGFSSSAIARPT
jgi:long-chain acyl-CoA synthetase